MADKEPAHWEQIEVSGRWFTRLYAEGDDMGAPNTSTLYWWPGEFTEMDDHNGLLWEQVFRDKLRYCELTDQMVMAVWRARNEA